MFLVDIFFLSSKDLEEWSSFPHSKMEEKIREKMRVQESVFHLFILDRQERERERERGLVKNKRVVERK